MSEFEISFFGSLQFRHVFLNECLAMFDIAFIPLWKNLDLLY